jgi:hypothetical protein
MSVPVFDGVPTFFRACCVEAAYQHNGRDYSHPGFHLAHHLYRLVPDNTERERWDEEVQALYALLDSQDFAAGLDWLVERFPKCMAFVPLRRRWRFLQGVYLSWLIDTHQCARSDARKWAREALRSAPTVSRTA